MLLKTLKKLVCHITGPRWAWQKHMIVNHSFTLTGIDRYTCPQVSSHYGTKAAEWWQQEIEEWCREKGMDCKTSFPFWWLARMISDKFDRETVRDSHERWLRLQFLASMKQKYSTQRQEKITLENPKKL